MRVLDLSCDKGSDSGLQRGDLQGLWWWMGDVKRAAELKKGVYHDAPRFCSRPEQCVHLGHLPNPGTMCTCGRAVLSPFLSHQSFLFLTFPSILNLAQQTQIHVLLQCSWEPLR